MADWFIVAGSDGTAVRLAEELVVIARDMQPRFRDPLEREGVRVLEGDARDASDLREAGLEEATALALVYALVTDAIVGVRLARSLGERPRPRRDHVVVLGLGRIGQGVFAALSPAGSPASRSNATRMRPVVDRARSSRCLLAARSSSSSGLRTARRGSSRWGGAGVLDGTPR